VTVRDPAGYPYTKVAFMDTNALHYVRLCLGHAKQHDLHPFGKSPNGWQELTTDFDTITPQRRRENMQTGVKMLQFVEAQGAQIEFSPMSEIEMVGGLIRAKALLHAARDGSPHRMFTNITAGEIAATVSAADMQEVGAEVDQLPELLDRLDITVTPSDPGAGLDTLRVAAQLTRIRYMEPADAVIFVGAILAQADYLITSDRYLRSTANQLLNSRDQPFLSARSQLRTIVANVLNCAPDEVILPQGWTPKSGS
jgi:hypothetical protein